MVFRQYSFVTAGVSIEDEAVYDAIDELLMDDTEDGAEQLASFGVLIDDSLGRSPNRYYVLLEMGDTPFGRVINEYGDILHIAPIPDYAPIASISRTQKMLLRERMMDLSQFLGVTIQDTVPEWYHGFVLRED